MELLDQWGWVQGTAQDLDGRMCAMGALNTAVKERVFADPYYRATDAFTYAIDALTRVVGTTPATFNDDPHTTVEDVKLAMKLAIELLEVP